MTKHQEKIALKIVKRLKKGKKVLLTGGGGVGKSFVTKYIKNKLGCKYKVTGIAPTHQACGILSHSCDIKAVTVAKFFKRKPDRDYITEAKKEVFLWKGGSTSVGKKTVLIVDEVSMIGADDIESFMALKSPILFVGDMAQLPPVNDKAHDMWHHIPVYELKKMMRSSGELSRFQSELRKKGFDSKKMEWRKNAAFPFYKGATVVRTEEEFLDLFKSTRGTKKIITYTNNEALRFARKLADGEEIRLWYPLVGEKRGMIYDTERWRIDARPFAPNINYWLDMADDPKLDKAVKYLKNAFENKVRVTKSKNEMLFYCGHRKHFNNLYSKGTNGIMRCLVKYLQKQGEGELASVLLKNASLRHMNVKDTGVPKSIWARMDRSHKLFHMYNLQEERFEGEVNRMTLLSVLFHIAVKNYPYLTSHFKLWWFFEKEISLNMVIAMAKGVGTAHSSQGESVETIFIDWDAMKDGEPELKYVALTRASKHLVYLVRK